MSRSTLTAPVLGLIQVRPQRPVKTEMSVLAVSNISNPKTSSMMKKSIDLPFTCIDTFTELTDGCGSISPNFIGNENPEPNRKRRLDHLTYEEKLKRKKLKNRVAAQTSRDRKKAQMDKLEDEIKQLKENNRKLAQANSRLQSEMNRLVSENVELLEKVSSMASCHSEDVQSLGVGCSPLNEGPAEGEWTVAGTGTGQATSTTDCHVEDFDFLHSLSELLADFQEDNSSCQLEELAASLLEEACDDGPRTASQAHVTTSSTCATQVVGTPSENMVPCGRLNPDITPMDCDSDTAPIPDNTHLPLCLTYTPQNLLNNSLIVPAQECTKTENSITILVTSDDEVCFDDVVEEVEVITSETDFALRVPECKEEPMSPCYAPSSPYATDDYISQYSVKDYPVSDCGYESLDSPQSDISAHCQLSDLWSESFSQLFPTLV